MSLDHSPWEVGVNPGGMGSLSSHLLATWQTSDCVLTNPHGSTEPSGTASAGYAVGRAHETQRTKCDLKGYKSRAKERGRRKGPVGSWNGKSKADELMFYESR